MEEDAAIIAIFKEGKGTVSIEGNLSTTAGLIINIIHDVAFQIGMPVETIYEHLMHDHMKAIREHRMEAPKRCIS